MASVTVRSNATKRSQNLIRLWMVAATMMFAYSWLAGKPSAAAPLTAAITFEVPPTVSLGEPIIGHYTITNTSDHDQMCWVGPQTNGCLTASDTISGKELPLNQSPIVYAEPGDGLMRAFSKSMHTGYFVINGWHEPGEHSLRLTVHFSYSAAQDNVSPGYGEHIDNNPVVNQVFETEVTVLPTNLRQVRETSEVLRRSILKEKDFTRRQIFITALFSMPGVLVHDCWARLVSDTRIRDTDQDTITQRLALTPSVEAADLLADQQWAQPPVCSYPFIPQDALASMYNNSDSALHQYIRDLYAQHGIQIADKIDIPQVGD